MIYFSIFILFIAVLDTLFGNRFFPSRVDVICKHRQYFVRKVHRYCFIPLKNIFSGTESKNQDELLTLVKVLTPEAQPIASGVGG